MKKKKKKSKRINEDARQKSEQIRKFTFLIPCKLNVLDLPHNSISMKMLISIICGENGIERPSPNAVLVSKSLDRPYVNLGQHLLRSV